MVRAPSIDKNGLKKGAWSEEEDNMLRAYVQKYGHWNWRQLPKFAGLSRCGKSCRLRWMNYLKPGVRRGNYTAQEEELILKLHKEFGNKWSVIAAQLPGRTDNDIKNHWHTHLRRKSKQDPKSTEETSDRSQIKDDSDHHEESFSISSFHSLQNVARMDPIKSTGETYDRSQNESDHNEDSPSSSMSSFDYCVQMMDQMETNYDNLATIDQPYGEVSSFSYDYSLFHGLLDLATEDSISSVDSIIQFQAFEFEKHLLGTPLFATDASNNSNYNLHQLFPPALEEESMPPFTPCLDEINWLL